MGTDQNSSASLLDSCSAVISGASSGLGAEFARQLAGRASCLVLAARSQDALKAVADEICAARTGLRVVVCACDLATDEGRMKLWTAIDAEGVQPDVLINNAGLGDYGSFASADEDRLRAQIDLNVTALTMMAREFLGRVAREKRTRPAAVVNVSSLAASLPMPDLAVYAATKSYVTSLSEALAVELEASNVRVLAVCPGPTPTNFSKTARRADGTDTDRSGQGLLRVLPSHVVGTALTALEQGKVRHFPGFGVRLAATLFEKMPRFLLRIFIRLRHRRPVVR